jgi:DNA-binding MarR family transcriptional regulator
VSLDDLAGTFKISSSEVVSRLKDFELNGRICGIVDDRGKYIYLTEKELSNIEKFFGNKGRVSKSELVAQCNKLIRFEPTEEDKEVIAQQNLDILKSIEEKEGKLM